jgi:hypothetical protein
MFQISRIFTLRQPSSIGLHAVSQATLKWPLKVVLDPTQKPKVGSPSSIHLVVEPLRSLNIRKNVVTPQNVIRWRMARWNVHQRVTRAGKEVNPMLSCNLGNVGRNG